jgi:GDP-mannose 6-dehydrogenase
MKKLQNKDSTITPVRPMRVAVVGLGYVGAVLMAGLSSFGHTVIGVGRNKKKLSTYSSGISPFHEPELDELLSSGVKSGRIQITDSHEEAIHKSDVSFVCVATPSAHDGGLEMDVTMIAAEQIAQALRTKKGYHVVCFRSTLFSGSTEDTLIPILETVSGKIRFKDFGVCYNPEFLREGIAVKDLYNPPFTVIGHQDKRSAEIVSSVYGYHQDTSPVIHAPRILCTIKEAEALKYACNAFHALKVVFANEIGTIYAKYNINPAHVMDMFVQDTKLNVSPKYLKPGSPYGGSCLGKDLRVLLTQAQVASVPTPILSAIEKSNQSYIQMIISDILSLGHETVGFLGLAFKEETDDLRESPALSIASALQEKGKRIHIFDPWVHHLIKQGLAGTLEKSYPQLIPSFETSATKLLSRCRLVVMTSVSYFRYAKLIPPGIPLCFIDLTGTLSLHMRKKDTITIRSPVLPMM